MGTETFGGDKKLPMNTLLAKYERKFIDSNLWRFPSWIQGYHLTLMTIPWSVGVIVLGYLARANVHWLWLASLMIFFQWFTDCFDGALGRYRDTGIPRWGYYMDHFLDYVFMSSIMVGYSFLFDGFSKQLVLLLLPVFGAFMVSSYTAFGATNEFKITYLRTGPTEMRICFVILNCLFIFFGRPLLNRRCPGYWPGQFCCCASWCAGLRSISGVLICAAGTQAQSRERDVEFGCCRVKVNF